MNLLLKIPSILALLLHSENFNNKKESFKLIFDVAALVGSISSIVVLQVTTKDYFVGEVHGKRI